MLMGLIIYIISGRQRQFADDLRCRAFTFCPSLYFTLTIIDVEKLRHKCFKTKTKYFRIIFVRGMVAVL